MPVESATYISQLDISQPSGTDLLADVDNHLRLIKSTLKNTFTNVTGKDEAQAALVKHCLF